MAGPGRPGPAPKDPEVRQRTNSPAPPGGEIKIKPEDFPDYVDINPAPPAPDERWHPLAREIYDALLSDPVRMNMTSGDWALAKLMIDNISRDMFPQVVATIQPADGQPGDVIREKVAMNGSRMANVLKWAQAIGLTDGARRSVGVHLTLGVPSSALSADTGTGPQKRSELFLVPPTEDE